MTPPISGTATLAESAPPPADFEAERLVAALRRGDADAFEALYRRTIGTVYGLAWRLTCRSSDAEELAQEVFVRAWEHREQMKSHSHFVHWAKRVAVHCWINELRKKRPSALNSAADPLDDDPSLLGTVPAPSGLALDLERAMAALSPRLRAVVTLFDLYGSTHEEIGELLGMTPGGSKVQLHRARTRLREALR